MYQSLYPTQSWNALHLSECEHSDAEFAKEQSDISVDTDQLYEVEEEIESSSDLQNFCRI